MSGAPRSLATRLIVAAGLWTAAALLAAGLILSAIFRDTAERAFERQLEVLLNALVAASEIDDAGAPTLSRTPGEPRFDLPYSGWYWQIMAGAQVLARSPSLFDAALAPPERGDGGAIAFLDGAGPNGLALRIAARDIRFPDRTQALRYVVAAPRADLEAEVARFNGFLFAALGLLGAGLIGAILVQVRFGLVPLRRLGESLAAVRHGRAGRLDTALPRELAPLAGELNALLDHNARLVERARTQVGNLAHGLKTPLSILVNAAGRAADAAGDEPLAETVRRQAAAMQRQIDHYLARARAAGSGGIVGARCPVGETVEALVRVLPRLHAGRALELATDIAAGLQFRGERQDLEEMIGNLADNACKWARRHVAIAAAADGAAIRIVVDDDGDGLTAGERATVLRRGNRLDETVPGSGLGLAIVSDLAALYGGTLALEDSPRGGVRAILTLPAAPV
jgi:signal transduction histidine kinase